MSMQRLASSRPDFLRSTELSDRSEQFKGTSAQSAMRFEPPRELCALSAFLFFSA